jgi:hypothetical protein
MTPSLPDIPNACFHVAAQVTPHLAPHPTYPEYLQTLANDLGVESDNCVDVIYSKNKPAKTVPNSKLLFMTWRDDWLNPIVNDVRQVWHACHDVPAVMDVLIQDDCYRKVVDVVKSEHDGKKDDGKNYDGKKDDGKKQDGKRHDGGNQGGGNTIGGDRSGGNHNDGDRDGEKYYDGSNRNGGINQNGGQHSGGGQDVYRSAGCNKTSPCKSGGGCGGCSNDSGSTYGYSSSANNSNKGHNGNNGNNGNSRCKPSGCSSTGSGSNDGYGYSSFGNGTNGNHGKSGNSQCGGCSNGSGLNGHSNGSSSNDGYGYSSPKSNCTSPCKSKSGGCGSNDGYSNGSGSNSGYSNDSGSNDGYSNSSGSKDGYSSGNKCISPCKSGKSASGCASRCHKKPDQYAGYPHSGKNNTYDRYGVVLAAQDSGPVNGTLAVVAGAGVNMIPAALGVAVAGVLILVTALLG